MNKEEIKYLIPIMQAFVDGKTIQCYNGMKWIDHTGDQCSFQFPTMFRIKPKEPTYRPFKNAEECWQEMLKHQPFGWITSQGAFFYIIYIEDKLFGYGSACGTILHSEFNDVLKLFKFADGLPFGVKVEE